MKSEIRFDNHLLSIRCPDAGINERRDVNAEDMALFDSWISRYSNALKKKGNTHELIAIGSDMFTWLNGSAGCLEKMIGHASNEFLLEFTVKARPDSDDLRFLEMPWELLAQHGRHLAEDEFLSFCPVRRIGDPGNPQAPSEYRLSTVFMAAAPRNGGVPLRYEEEEAAIIDAAGNIGMDLTVEESGNLQRLSELLSLEPADVLHISCHGHNIPEPVLALESEEGDAAIAVPRDLNHALGTHKPRLLFLSACKTSEPSRLINTFSASMI